MAVTRQIAVGVLLSAFSACGCRSVKPRGEPSRFLSVHAVTPSAGELEAALDGRFTLAGKPVALKPPVDWTQDPYSDRSWRFWLHSWLFLEPLLQHHERTGDLHALLHAKELALDWIRQNGRDTPGISEFAWYDMAVAGRAAYLGYMVRVTNGSCAATVEEQRLLMNSALEHGDWLAEDANYKSGHNHGLYQDAGLSILATQIPIAEHAPQWRRVAERRFGETVRATVSLEDAVHQEHSPQYHDTVTNLLRRFSQQTRLGGEAFVELAERMEANAGWLVMPDGKYPQLGDTDLVSPPPWVDTTSRRSGSAAFLDAGYVVVREQDAYLIAACAYHGHGHKHADELTFSWYDAGHRLVVDTGRYGYYYDEPGRRFAESSRAHNVVTVNGASFPWRDAKPYGSCIEASGSGAGWYAIEGHNPLLEPDGVQHRRLWLYRPGSWLVIVDNMAGQTVRTFRRTFHLAPSIELSDAGSAQWLAIGDGVSLRIADATIGRAAATVTRGQKVPEVQGFTFPANREWRQNTVLQLDAEASTTQLVTLFRLGGSGPLFGRVARAGESVDVEVRDDVGSRAIRLRRSGTVIEVGPAP